MPTATGAPPSPHRLRLAEDGHPAPAPDPSLLAALRGFLLARGRLADGLDPTDLGRDWCPINGAKERVFATGHATLALDDPGIETLLTQNARGVPVLYGYPTFVDEEGRLRPLFTVPARLKAAGYKEVALAVEPETVPAVEAATLVAAGTDVALANAAAADLSTWQDSVSVDGPDRKAGSGPLPFERRLARLAALLDTVPADLGGRTGPTEPWDAWPGPRWTHLPLLFRAPAADRVWEDIPHLEAAMAIALGPTALHRALRSEEPTQPLAKRGDPASRRPPETALPVYRLPSGDAGAVDRLAAPPLGALVAPPGSARLPAIVALAAADIVAGRRVAIVTEDAAQADRVAEALQRTVAPGRNWALTGRPKRLLAWLDGLTDDPADAPTSPEEGADPASALTTARKAFGDARTEMREAQRTVADALAGAGQVGMTAALDRVMRDGTPTGPLRDRVDRTAEAYAGAARSALLRAWRERRRVADRTVCRQALGRLADYAGLSPADRYRKPHRRDAVDAWRALETAAPVAILTLAEVDRLLPLHPDLVDRIVIDGADRMTPAELAPLLLRARQATLTTRHPAWTLPLAGWRSETLASVADRQPDALLALSDGSFNGALRLAPPSVGGPAAGPLVWIDRPVDRAHPDRDPVVPTLLAFCHEAVESGRLGDASGADGAAVGSVVVTALDRDVRSRLDDDLAPFRDRDPRYRRILCVPPAALIDRRADLVAIAAPVTGTQNASAAALRARLPDILIDALGAARLAVTVVGDRRAALEAGGPLARLVLQTECRLTDALPTEAAGRLTALATIADLTLVGQPGGVRIFTPLGSAYDFALPEGDGAPEWPRLPAAWLTDGDWHLPALFARLI